MASSRWKDDRRYDQLVKGTHKLHKDIDELETAYLLHRKHVDEDQNSVRGLIRKEVGGSRWTHGGAGKLTTYKSSKDLVDQENIVQSNGTSRYQQSSRDTQRSRLDNGDVPANENNNSSAHSVGLSVKPDKILDLKTKVLKKASSHIIRRDTWAVSDDKESIQGKNVSKSKKNELKQEARKVNSASKAQKPSTVKRSNSLKRENGETTGSPTYVANKAKTKQQNKVSSQTTSKNPSKENNISQREQPNRRSRREMFNESRSNNISDTVRLPSNGQIDLENSVNGIDKNNVDKIPTGVTYTPRKLQVLNGRNSPHINKEPQRIFATQPPEPTEIYIDPKTGQVRVTAAKDGTANLDGTRVLIEPGSVHNSVEANRLTCSIVDNETSDSNRRNEIRDIFGLDEFKTQTSDGVTFYKTATAPYSPLTTAKQCNTEVEFWLRCLGIPDVDKYVNIFAENNIDLMDLEFMSASQLHDMGVTAFGALDRILKGIRDLKNQKSFNYVQNPSESKSKHLTASSVAWEEVDDSQRRRAADIKSKASKTENPCHNQTYTKEAKASFDTASQSRNLERSNSVLSNVSESVDSARPPSRCETPNPSFAASTRASSAKCVDKKRPPSAKSSSSKSSATNQSTGKNNNQSVIKNNNQSVSKNINQSQIKTGSSSLNGSQSAVKLKRSNSAASERSLSKLKNIENKPNKGVLLRPRSSSLTREASRVKNDRDTSVKKSEDKKEPPRQLRARSRSADVVKRKALEGVQAAAKKFEERTQKGASKGFPPQDERKKLRRDEMAARHIQRERYKEITPQNEDSSDTDQDQQDQTLVDDDDQNLQSLVTVNIMSPQKKNDPNNSSQEDKSIIVRPQVRRSLRTTRSRSGQSSLKPLTLHMETDPPLLASYKVGNKDHSRTPSEPESGYKTDGSTTYGQIEDRVRDIQLKIKRLKARATSGDDMTLALVHDLQQQLLHFERQLKDKDSGSRSHRSGSSSHRGDLPISTESKASGTPRTPRTPMSSARLSVNASTQSTCETDNTETSTVTTVIQRVPNTAVDAPRRQDGADTDGVRMSKQELLDEMRKEKQQHHLQIIQLQSELQRFKHAGPVSSLELDPKDICYKIEDLIGEGTFSRVYQGEYQGSEVAIKQLKVPLQQQDKNYFAAEVSLLKELRHPRVVLLIGVCTTSKLPVMLLEFMSRGSLHDYLHNPECESLDHALYYQVARDIASGMNYLHSHKPEVLHLDLKSMNVLLCQSLRAKIADFGFSKLRLENGSKSGRKGKPKTSANVPAWMSPELLDKGEITGKSDVYSFGIILWEMLTRCLPYIGLSVFQVLEMVRKKNRPQIPDGTPEGLAHLINLCWDHNPAKRPQFKDVLQILENLAFPPAWRELFQKAGVPDSALQDVNSTRTIISLVTGTLDSGKSSILHSFMVAPGNMGNNSVRSSKKGKTEVKGKKTEKLSLLNSKDGRKKISSRSSNQTSEWDSDVISSLSDESEFTLKNLQSSSDECEYESDESSILSSDDQSFVAKNQENTTKKTINVMVPNLELDIQSARDKLKAERMRITGEPDWLSISLDDRTQRSNTDRSLRTSQRKEDSELRLALKSSLSNRSPTPPCLASEEVNVANESARSRRRNKSKDLTRYSDEFLRRESFDNLRPPSPKKKTPLAQKLADSPSKSLAVGRNSMIEMKSRTERVPSNSKKDSFAEKSYDSFFGHSSQEPGYNKTTPNSCRSDRTIGDVDSESHDIQSLKLELAQMNSDSVPLGRKSISNKDELCVEDMENDCELELNVTDRNVPEKETHVSDKNISSFKTETESASPPAPLSDRNNGAVTNSVDVTGDIEHLDSQSEKKPVKLDLDINQSLKESKLFKKGLEASLKCSKDNIESMTKLTELNVNQSGTSNPPAHDSENTLKLAEQAHLAELNQSESLEQSETTTRSARLRSSQSQANEQKIQLEKNMPGNSESKSGEFQTAADKRNDIRVVLNEMLVSRDSFDKTDTVVKKRSASVEKSDSSPCNNVDGASELKSKDNGDEEIRVKLNLEDVSRRKKPTITPRRSVKAKTVNSMTNIDKDEKSEVNPSPKKSTDNTNIVSSSQTSAEALAKRLSDALSTVQENKSKENHNTSEKEDNSRQSIASQENLNIKSSENYEKKSQSIPSQEEQASGSERDRRRHRHRSKPSTVDNIPSPKKKTIRVKLKKDPLVPQMSREMASPVPPPPPPPPLPVISQSVQIEAPRRSMADELKLKVANRQSVSEGMLRSNKTIKKQIPVQSTGSKNMLVPRPVESGPKLMNIAELDETFIPQQSDGLPLMVQSLELRDQKDQLRSISRPHPQQFDDLSNASQEQLSSIADILKKAVMNRRLAMGEDGDSLSQSMESAATGWSVDC